jgi:hypothetical protein
MKTLSGKLLLGWMSKPEALAFLVGEAVPAMTEEAAIALWECYRAKVAALGNRGCPKSVSGKHNLKEKLAIEKIIKSARALGGHNIKGLAKIDPLNLVVHQLRILEEKAEPYRNLLRHPVRRVKTCLPPLPSGCQLQSRIVGGKTIVYLPHGEFQLLVGTHKKLEISEQAHHIAVTAFSDRLLLWAGYHRTYASIVASQEYPEETERLLPTALTTDAETFLGAGSPFPEKRDVVRGPCPALFRDFFDADLCMDIKLRKRRCQVEIDLTGARMTWVDDES